MNAIKNTLKEFTYIEWPTIKETLSKTVVVILFSLFIGLISFLLVSLFLPVFGGIK